MTDRGAPPRGGVTLHEPLVASSRPVDGEPRALVAGWFSFVAGEATAGDLLAGEEARRWLEEAGYRCDVALSPAFAGGVTWDEQDPARYAVVAFVCGPAGGTQLDRLLDRFERCTLVGLNLSLVDPDVAARFDLLWERDSDTTCRPDLSLGPEVAEVPAVAVVRAHAQPEYGHDRLDEVHDRILAVLGDRGCAAIALDTRVDPALSPIAPDVRSSAELASLLRRMDAVVSTRLHGLVLALKHGVPAVAIDPVVGGAKVRRQAQALGWPLVLTADEADEDRLHAALDRCLEPQAREQAAECRDTARAELRRLRREVVAELARRASRRG